MRRTSPFHREPGPIALAHRGGAGEAAENSPAAFERAVSLGFRFIETDVRATRDGHALVLHDATLERTSDLAGAVAALPLAHAARAVLADGTSPITLVEALRRWPTVRFNVDVKSDDAVAPFLAAVDAASAWDRVCAASFSTARLRRLRGLAGPRLATSMGPAEVSRLVLAASAGTQACAAQVPMRAGRIPLVTARFVHRAHARGLHVHVWTVDDPAQMHALLDLGVDGIVSDRPSVLRRVLDERGLWR